MHSPQWTGFYRLEYGLWHGQPARELTPVAAKLTRDVLALRKAWPGMQVAQLDVGLRTHEILENALQFQLTGADDYCFFNETATTETNITGTRELLALLHPLLVPRYAALPGTERWLDRLQALLEKQHRPDGSWVPVASLPPAAREQINAACSQALQLLAPIADIAEPRNIYGGICDPTARGRAVPACGRAVPACGPGPAVVPARPGRGRAGDRLRAFTRPWRLPRCPGPTLPGPKAPTRSPAAPRGPVPRPVSGRHPAGPAAADRGRGVPRHRASRAD